MPDPNILFKNAPPSPLNESFHNALVNYDAVKTMPLKNQLLEQRIAAGDTENQQNKLKFQIFDMANDALQLKPVLESGNIGAAMQAVDRRVEKIKQRGGDPSDTLAFRKLLESGDVGGAMTQLDAPINAAQRLGIMGGSGGIPAELKVFQALNKAAGSTPEQQAQAARVALGLDPRASTIKVVDIGGVPTVVDSNANTATPISIGGREISVGDIAGNRAQIAAAESGASEGAKLDQQAMKAPQIAGDTAEAESEARKQSELKYGPQIARDIKIAEEKAKANGETLTDLARLEAAMPGLTTAVEQLKELAPIATSTLGGKIFDTAVKETGFGATEGATAKAKFIAIVNNQVLPLLRPTFGAAFTAKEGDALRASLADPDASPAEKIAQLEAFITQKRRDVETKQREIQNYESTGVQQSTPPQPQIREGQTATNPQTGQKIIFRGGRWVPM